VAHGDRTEAAIAKHFVAVRATANAVQASASTARYVLNLGLVGVVFRSGRGDRIADRAMQSVIQQFEQCSPVRMHGPAFSIPARPEHNAPTILALLAVWYNKLLAPSSRSSPLRPILHRFPAICSKLDMESNRQERDPRR